MCSSSTVPLPLAKDKGTVLSEHTLHYKLVITKAGQDHGRTRLLVGYYRAKFDNIKKTEMYSVDIYLGKYSLCEVYSRTDCEHTSQLPSLFEGRVHWRTRALKIMKSLPGRLVLHLADYCDYVIEYVLGFSRRNDSCH